MGTHRTSRRLTNRTDVTGPAEEAGFLLCSFWRASKDLDEIVAKEKIHLETEKGIQNMSQTTLKTEADGKLEGGDILENKSPELRTKASKSAMSTRRASCRENGWSNGETLKEVKDNPKEQGG